MIQSIFNICSRNSRSFAINAIGLSIGFSVLIAIVFFIREELGYNQFHENIDNIFAVFTRDNNAEDGLGWNSSVPAMAEALRTEYPEVKDAALYYSSTLRMLFSYNENKFYEQVQLADPNIFHIFSFRILDGKISGNTHETKIIALSKKFAKKYFGEQNPVGETIQVSKQDVFTVVAVFDDIPSNSSFQFDIWMPIQLLEDIYAKDHLNTWDNLSFENYVLLHDNVDIKKLNSNLLNRIQQSNPESKERSYLYPFKDLYLKAWGHNKKINMMILIALVILIIVSLNFINLQMADALVRIRNFGVKKINGASNYNIIKQLTLEALFYCIIAIIIAGIITQLSSPYLLKLLGKSSVNTPIISINALLMVSFVAIIMSLFSGIIPGIVISKVSPVNAIKNKVREHFSTKKLWMFFTPLQFSIAIGLIICLFTINRQLTYLRNKNLGFNKDQIVYIHLEGDLIDKRELLIERLSKEPSIYSATSTSRSPIGIYWNGRGWEWEGKPKDYDPSITYIETDKNFLETFQMELLEGNFSDSDVPKVVINETFANMISKDESLLGQLLVYPDDNISVNIGGVIKDIHFKPLHQKITPLMIIPQLGYDKMKYIFIKISPLDMDKTLAFIEETVTELNPDFPCEYFFLDNDFAHLYETEKRLRDQMGFFSIMAILIACMGLWGILIFMVKQRTKEIGIRKVNGAKIWEVMALLNRDFVIWVAIAFFIATPIAYYTMNRWLQNFAYRTELSWWIFALAGFMALGIALMTVSFQSWRAARRNPVEALRYE